MAKEKATVGRPTDYKECYNEQARKLCLLGYTDEELADFFNVATSTIYNWKNQYPAFLEAIKSGKEFADSDVANSLYNRAKGMRVSEQRMTENGIVEVSKEIPPDTAAAFIWLKNRQPRFWRDKTEVAVDSTVTANVDLKADVTVKAALDDFKSEFMDE